MNRKRIMISVSVAVAMSLIVGIGIFATRQSADAPDRLLSLGEKYLTELNYEQALVQFLKVIEIDPMNPRGYTGAAEAYVGLGQTGDAVTILRQGLERTGDDGIQNMLDNLTYDDETDQDNLNDIDRTGSEDAESGEIAPEIDLSNIAPFGFEDVAVMGYPWGVSVYELQDRGLLENVEISEDSGYLSIYHPDQNIVSNTYFRNPKISFHENGLISHITIEDNDPTIGPRGTKIGMTVEEIMRFFKCDNTEVIKYFENSAIDMPNRISLYSTYEDSTYYYGNIFPSTEKPHLSYDVKQEHASGECRLKFNINNDVVSSIEVYYLYN